MYYEGQLRQRGGLGLGNALSAFGRFIDFKGLANTFKKKALDKAIKFGVGVVKDVAKKKSFKQALKDQGKSMITDALKTKRGPDDALNTSGPPRKRQKRPIVRRVNTRPRRRKKNKTRSRDIFD